MAESSLSLGYAEFLAEIGYAAGFGRDSVKWSAEQASLVARILDDGIRQFYFPPALPGETVPHRWTWLMPTFTIQTTANDYDQDLPDDFAGLEGDLTFAPGEGWRPVRVVGEARIRELRETDGAAVSGRPQYAAVRPKTADGATGQRWEIVFWPTPDATYNLTGRKHALYSKLSAANPYPLGGAAHAQAALKSCLAAYEIKVEKIKGPCWGDFLDALRSSVFQDRAQQPTILGYNRDASDGRDRAVRYDRTTYVYVNGVLPP